MEIWKDIDDSYEVSSIGRIRSKDRIIPHPYRDGVRIHHRKGKMKSLVSTIDGYLRVKLYRKYVSVSHLVATAFIPNPHGYTDVHHINHDHQDNRVENLMWVSKEEHNTLHTEEKVKTVYQYTLDGELVKVWNSANEAARELGFNQAHISDCCLGKRKTHKGFIWSYELK